MTNKIAVFYDAVSFVMSKMKSGVAYQGTYLTQTRKTVASAVLWGTESVVEIPPSPAVIFQDIHASHTLHVTFFRAVNVGVALGSHTKLLLNFDHPIVSYPSTSNGGTPDYYGRAEYSTTRHVASVADDSVYNHQVYMLNHYPSGTDPTTYYNSRFTDSEFIAGTRSYFGGSTVVSQQFKDGCNLGGNDFTIDFWWKFRLLSSTAYNSGLYSQSSIKRFGFSDLLTEDSNFFTVSETLIGTKVYQLRGSFTELGADSDAKPVFDTGTASETDPYNSRYTLIDSTKSWVPGSLVGKYVTITGGQGSVSVNSGQTDSEGVPIYVYPTNKYIWRNTETTLDIISDLREDDDDELIEDISYAFPAVLDNTSQYQIYDRIPQWKFQIHQDERPYQEASQFDASQEYPLVYSGIFGYDASYDDTWIHVAFVRKNGTIVCYVDGTALTTEFHDPYVWDESGGQYLMQAFVGYNPYIYLCNMIGYIDVFRINNIALWDQNFDPYDHLLAIEFDLNLSFVVTPESVYRGDYVKLLAHMDGSEGSSTIVDNSIYEHPMTAMGGLTLTGFANAVYGAGAYFGGLGSSLGISDSNDWDLSTTEWTIDFWVKVDSIRISGVYDGDELQHVFFSQEKDSTTGRYVYLQLGTTIGGYVLWLHDGSLNRDVVFDSVEVLDPAPGENPYSSLMDEFWNPPVVSGVEIVYESKFTHLAVVEHAGAVKLYVNGKLALSPYLDDDAGWTTSDFTNFNGQFLIGSGARHSFVGFIKNFRISKGIARWLDFFTPPMAYTMDVYTRLFLPLIGEIGETHFTNMGLGSYVITNQNVAVAGSDNAFGNSAAYFDGVNDYIEVPDSNDWSYGQHDWTIDFRIKILSIKEGSNPIISQGVVDSGSHFALVLDVTGSTWTVSLLLNGSVLVQADATSMFTTYVTEFEQELTEQWGHIAVICYLDKIHLYLNGTESEEFAEGYTLSNIPAPLMIGSDGVDFFKGFIDELRISHRAEWTADFAPPTEPYINPIIVPIGEYFEVNPVFEATASMEQTFRAPGEYDILIEDDLSLILTRNDYEIPNLTFNSPMSLHFLSEADPEVAIFTFNNRWKKDLMAQDFVLASVEGDYRVALMNEDFVFDPDTHDYFVDQLDADEITSVNGYASGLGITFSSFSAQGVLSFENFEFPVASGGAYGPIKSILIYDYGVDVRGRVVGNLELPEVIIVRESVIKISDLSFQIV